MYTYIYIYIWYMTQIWYYINILPIIFHTNTRMNCQIFKVCFLVSFQGFRRDKPKNSSKDTFPSSEVSTWKLHIFQRVRTCFGNSLFGGGGIFWEGVGGGFRAVQAPFWENPGVKCRFRAGFSGHLGVVLGLSNQRWNAGFVRAGHEKLLQKANCPVHLCLLRVCIYVCFYMCVCLW